MLEIIYRHPAISGLLFGAIILALTALAHELGHRTTARAAGLPAQLRARWQKGIEKASWPTIIWGYIDDQDLARTSHMQRFRFAMAGPFANLVLAAAVLPWVQFNIGYDQYFLFFWGDAYAMSLTAWLAMVAFFFNVIFFLSNIVPIHPESDGRRCLTALRGMLQPQE